jgi:DNA helicase IV
MSETIASLEELDERAQLLRRDRWSPGTCGARLCRDTDWTANVDGESLCINAEKYPLHALQSVHLSRGLIWARVLVEYENGATSALGGLTNRLASAFVASLTAACVLSARQRLKELAADLGRRWSGYANRSRWIAQSEAKRFIEESLANAADSWPGRSLTRAFTRTAYRYLHSEDASQLALLDSSNLLRVASAQNERFLREALTRYQTFFDQVEKNPLTEEQRRAVVTFDDNVMAVAAAGSGKTSVMVAKAGYAVLSGLFAPEQILLLAFNRKAADELAHRVRERLSNLGDGAARITIATFHSFGLNVVGHATGKKPLLAPWVAQDTELDELSDIVKEAAGDPVFRLKWLLFRTVFARSLPPFGVDEEPEWWDRETGRRGFLTLRGETVNSQEEQMICNWLAVQGIDYEYERPYEHDTATTQRRQYIPDFYYPSADVYHEHFALDEHGKPPAKFAGYADGIRWKRALHAERGTKLIETTSYGIRSARGFADLEQKLRANGVVFGEVPLIDEQMKPVPDEASLLRVFRTFLSHVKSNRLTMDDLRHRATSRASQHPYRDQLFLDLFERLWAGWQDRLAAARAVDFDDMLGEAADHLAAGRCTMPYSLVMADEFQDTSRARAVLLRELTKAPAERLFVVGDDWQAINRFAGADISLMRDFERFFGCGSVVKLTETFRCPHDLCQIASKFVLANPFQIEKAVVTANRRKPPSVVCFKLDDIEAQDALLFKHLRLLAERVRASVPATSVSAYVLGRNHFNEPVGLHQLRGELEDVVDVRFSTVHAAKGLEADYVFIMNVIEGSYGFPNKIEDDSTLWIAMPEGEDFRFAEERRLFYVALTRAKRLVTIYTEVHRRSEFIAEIERQAGPMDVRFEDEFAKGLRTCPRCQVGIVSTRTGKYGDFLGCSRFPRCDYTEPLRSRRK